MTGKSRRGSDQLRLCDTNLQSRKTAPAAKWAVALAACLSAQSIAAAQAPPGVQPGTIEREFERPAAPRSERGISVGGPEAPMAPEAAEQIKFTLQSVTFRGNTALSSEELNGLAAGMAGREVSLAAMFALAAEVTRLYAERGYALGVAFLPKQEIDGGNVVIEIVEGYVAEVVIKGDTAGRDDLWRGMRNRILASRPLRTADLERALLLADDLPGVSVSSVFDRSEAGHGAAQLTVMVERKMIDASASLSNRGSAALGPYRIESAFTFNNVLGLSEAVSLSGVQTLDADELSYLSGRIAVPVSPGLTAFAEGTYSKSLPGTFLLSLLEYDGEGVTASIGLEYAAIRTRHLNLFLSGQFTFKDLKTDVLGFPFSADRLAVLEAKADFDMRDEWGGLNQVALRLSMGLDALNATDFNDPLRGRFTATGKFYKAELTLARVQDLGRGFSLYAQATGQISDRPLLQSEQCGYGGGLLGRAFDSFEISGDNCVLAALELRYDIPPVTADLALQAYVFGDAGWVRARGALGLGDRRSDEAQSAGLGLRAWYTERFSAGLEVAFPFSRGVALEDNSEDPRVFGFIGIRY